MYKFNFEFSELYFIAGFRDVELRAGKQFMLLQLSLNKPYCQVSGVNRKIEISEKVRNSADMVLMTVGDDKTLDFIPVFKNIGEIRNNYIYARCFLIRERHSAVHKKHIPVIFVKSYIFSDFSESAERNDFKRL